MSAVSETIVREYFELHGFFVRQQRKHVAPSRGEDEEMDFFVLNPTPAADVPPRPFVLSSAHLAGIARAVVAVKGWHTETFSPAVIERAPEIFRFVEAAAFRQAARAFGGSEGLLKILVVPGLPQDRATRNRSIELLQGKGVDALLPFRTLLEDLIRQIEPNRNYQKSDLLQTIRILKIYDCLREPQLELFKSRPRRRAKASTKAEAPSEPPPVAPGPAPGP